jgi:hypothetical protein
MPERRLTASHVLAYEPMQNHGFMQVLYGDNHVDRLSPPESTRVLAELQAGFNPPRPAPR